MEQIHATAVEIDGAGVLILGPSGSGKSDLALRLIDDGARLVADDRVDLLLEEGRVYASAPALLAGLLEVRGVGIIEMAHAARSPLVMMVTLSPPDAVDRLPDEETAVTAGVPLPFIRLTPFEVSAPAKLRVALRVARGDARRHDRPAASVRRDAS